MTGTEQMDGLDEAWNNCRLGGTKHENDKEKFESDTSRHGARSRAAARSPTTNHGEVEEDALH